MIAESEADNGFVPAPDGIAAFSADETRGIF
jgi:hypothetical protein